MTPFKYLVAGLLSLALTGCVSFTPTGPIGLPSQAMAQSVPVALCSRTSRLATRS